MEYRHSHRRMNLDEKKYNIITFIHFIYFNIA